MMVVLVPNMAERMPWKSEAGNSSFFFPLAFHCPSKNSLGTEPEQNPPGAPSQGKKKEKDQRGRRSAHREIKLQSPILPYFATLCLGELRRQVAIHSMAFLILRKFFGKVVFVLGLLAQVISATCKVEV